MVNAPTAASSTATSWTSDRVSSDYSTTRHAGVIGALYALGRIDAADAGLGYVRENLISHDDWTAFAPVGESVSVGTNSLAGCRADVPPRGHRGATL